MMAQMKHIRLASRTGGSSECLCENVRLVLASADCINTHIYIGTPDLCALALKLSHPQIFPDIVRGTSGHPKTLNFLLNSATC